MTTIELPTEDAPKSKANVTRWWHVADRQLEDLGEYLNPILVKETRQALKSRQFAVTFALVLLTSWLWSLMAIYFRYPGILYSPDGPFLLVGYLDILLFPLIVIIPFSAFRSLAAEREDGTFELLSISTLSPRQIISGKLISSVLQMLVYLSALAPCIGFTYLLRGIDIITIAYVLAVAFLISVLLSAVGLVIACVTQQRHWQSALSVVVIVLFIFLFCVGLGISSGSIYEDSSWRMYDDSDFWILSFALLSVYFSYLYLVVELASAQITFESENRSAGIRLAVLIQHFLAVGWMGYLSLRFPRDEEPMIAMITILCLHWFIMGSFMNGESSVLSPRIKRDIPKNLLDRLLQNWRLPGPDRGFFFVMTGLLSGLLVVIGLVWINTFTELAPTMAAAITAYSVGLVAFTLCYLGTGRLLVRALNLVFRVDVFVSVIVHLLLLMAAVITPLAFQVMTNRTMDRNYNHWTNPFWFFIEAVDDSSFLHLASTVVFVAFLALLSGFFLLVNILLGASSLVPGREEDSQYVPESPPKAAFVEDDPLL